MKHIVVTLILGSTLYANASLENSSFKVDTFIQPRATYSIQEFYNKFQNSQPFGDLGSITIQNKLSTTQQLVIRVKAYASALGTSPVIDAVTDPTALPISISAGGTFVFNPQSETSSIAKLHQMSQSEIENRVTAKYGANLLTDMAGLAPADTYTYEIFLYSESDTGLTTPLIGPITETITLFLEYGNIDIIAPNDASELSGYPINFIWQDLNIREGANAHFIFRLWDTNPLSSDVLPRITVGASGSDLAVNNDLRGKTLFSHTGTNFEKLTPGHTYFWQVTAKDELNIPIGLGGGSPIYTFKMKAPLDEATLTLTSREDLSPAAQTRFTWALESATPIDVTYTLIVKDNSGSVVLSEETSLTSYTAASNFNDADSSWTWYVIAKDTYDNTRQSNVLAFQDNQNDVSGSTNQATQLINTQNHFRELLSINGMDQKDWRLKTVKKDGAALSEAAYNALIKEALSPNGGYYLKPYQPRSGAAQ